MTFNVDEFLSGRGRRTEKVAVLLRSDLIAARNDLRVDWQAAVKEDELENRVPEAPKIRKQIDKLNEEIERAVQWFKFGEISRYEYEKLVRRHPAKAADQKLGLPFDAEGFPPAVIAAASVDPKLSQADAEKLYRELPKAEADRLFHGALAPQMAAGDLPLALRGTGLTQIIEENSGTADPEESQEASS